MLPLIVFLVMIVPFGWAMFLTARLGWRMKHHRSMDSLTQRTEGRSLPEMLSSIPDSRRRFRQICFWFVFYIYLVACCSGGPLFVFYTCSTMMPPNHSLQPTPVAPSVCREGFWFAKVIRSAWLSFVRWPH
jgi:hypothetical protein